MYTVIGADSAYEYKAYRSSELGERRAAVYLYSLTHKSDNVPARAVHNGRVIACAKIFCHELTE